MRIVVLAGGLSMERNVSLSSGNKICRALRSRGHQAILVDMFLGFEDYEGKLDDVFDAPDGFCGDYSVAEAEPDLAAASVNAAGSYVYMNIERSNGKDFYYEYYRLKLEVSVTEYESVDPDAAGAGISGYKIEVKSDRITGTR